MPDGSHAGHWRLASLQTVVFVANPFLERSVNRPYRGMRWSICVNERDVVRQMSRRCGSQCPASLETCYPIGIPRQSPGRGVAPVGCAIGVFARCICAPTEFDGVESRGSQLGHSTRPCHWRALGFVVKILAADQQAGAR